MNRQHRSPHGKRFSTPSHRGESTHDAVEQSPKRHDRRRIEAHGNYDRVIEEGREDRNRLLDSNQQSATLGYAQFDDFDDGYENANDRYETSSEGDNDMLDNFESKIDSSRQAVEDQDEDDLLMDRNRRTTPRH